MSREDHDIKSFMRYVLHLIIKHSCLKQSLDSKHIMGIKAIMQTATCIFDQKIFLLQAEFYGI